MPQQPLVSIVINSFNQDAYLEKTILSVLGQRYEPLEIILVDGGSTDGSLDIIKRYEDRFSWWVSEKDQGQADGINKGLSRATGDLVAWLNSDDLYLPGTIEAAAKTWQARPESALVYGDVISIDGNGKTIRRIPCGEYQLQDLMSFRIINQPAVFMNRKILTETGYLSSEYHFLLDHHLWLRMASRASTIHVPKVWSAGRFHPSAKNLAQADKFGEEAYRIARWLSEAPEFAAVYPAIKNSVRAGAHRMNARYLLDADQPRLALSAYWKSLKSDPSVALPEWHRMVYCLLSMAGLKKLKQIYLDLRRILHPVKMDQ